MKEIRAFLENKVVKFAGHECKPVIRPYTSGRIYMQLLDHEDGSPVARVTLDIDSIPVIDDMMIVKSYSENEGIYQSLLEAGIIKPAERKYAIGFEEAHICFFNLPKS